MQRSGEMDHICFKIQLVACVICCCASNNESILLECQTDVCVWDHVQDISNLLFLPLVCRAVFGQPVGMSLPYVKSQWPTVVSLTAVKVMAHLGGTEKPFDDSLPTSPLNSLAV